ncbi:hypothetical protein CVT25_010250 [Psilocybe cyanescens]|uniref:Uncharacterized protein n=1 Tax=Psilocybe cyanescens TaxID=93625 RepID=A0A409X2R4_PSICY|nr:hypothetical protein CVT25_010250 [Psilocybe cyanescens]
MPENVIRDDEGTDDVDVACAAPPTLVEVGTGISVAGRALVDVSVAVVAADEALAFEAMLSDVSALEGCDHRCKGLPMLVS